jgi:hypothetical protein
VSNVVEFLLDSMLEKDDEDAFDVEFRIHGFKAASLQFLGQV